MTTPIEKEQLGIYSNTPFLEKIVRGIYTVVYFLFLNPVSFLLTDILYGILIVLLVSSKFRFFSGTPAMNWLVGIVLFIVFIIWGVLIVNYFFRWFNRVVFGRPVFGKIGGVDRTTFFTVLETSQNMEFKFGEDDEYIKSFNQLDAEITEYLLKSNYVRLVDNDDSLSDGDIESRWKAVWEDQILNVGKGGLTTRDYLADDNLASRVIPGILSQSAQVIGPFINVFQLIMIYSLIRYLNGETQLLVTIQTGVFLTFILTILWFIFHAFQVSEIQLFVNYDNLPAEIKEKFAGKAKSFIGRKLYPLKITLTNRYYALVRGYTLRQILITLVNSALGLVMIGLILGFEVLRNSADREAIFAWYQQLAIGMLIIPVFFYIGFYLISVLIQNFRQVLLVLITGLLTAALPFIFNYLVTGNFPVNDVQVAINSAVSGLGVALSALVIANIKTLVEGEKEKKDKD